MVVNTGGLRGSFCACTTVSKEVIDDPPEKEVRFIANSLGEMFSKSAFLRYSACITLLLGFQICFQSFGKNCFLLPLAPYPKLPEVDEILGFLQMYEFCSLLNSSLFMFSFSTTILSLIQSYSKKH